jgi:hypothetical protein
MAVVVGGFDETKVQTGLHFKHLIIIDKHLLLL